MTKNGDQTNAGGDQSYRVSITPTWEAIAKISIEALLNGTGEGQRMAREEIIDLGIKLDDAKEIIEERLKPTPSLQVQFGETEALIEEKDKIIGQLESKVKARDKELNANDDHIEELEQKLGEKNKTISELKDDFDKGQDYIADLENQIATKNGELATLRDQIINLGEDPEYDAELANYDGQDTSIDEQVANNQPHREGDA